jgi:hypothetical protein
MTYRKRMMIYRRREMRLRKRQKINRKRQMTYLWARLCREEVGAVLWLVVRPISF